MTTPGSPTPVLPRRATRLSPLGLQDVAITGGFWQHMQDLNRNEILPHCDSSLDRVGWIDNFRAVTNGTVGETRTGREFSDSEIYKTMEAMAWEHARVPTPELLARLEELTAVLEAAQADDGYLNTYFGYPGGPERYTDLDMGHELYCAGHLIQAAVASARAGGPPQFLALARRLADHIDEQFGPTGTPGIDGHPEIEPALVELYRLTGEPRYLELARLFVERRGHRTHRDHLYAGRDYYQDNVPVREAEVLVGHAVRALYLSAGALDVAVETRDDDLFEAVRRQYDRTLDRRTYLTGGMGSHHAGETFGDDFELPADRAYAETCAAVASIMVAWRLLLTTGEPRYADAIERTLYNTIAASPSVDGRSFFYVNALHRRIDGIEPDPGVPSLRKSDGTRASWFVTSCCPTNTARTLASMGALMATHDDAGIQVHQYAPATIEAAPAGRSTRLRIETEYSRQGTVRIVVEQTDGAPWALQLRVPGWATGATVVVDGEPTSAGPGTVTVERAWQPGDVVTLELDVTPFLVHPDPRIDAVRGCVAVQRGPVVYALESPDHPGVDLESVTINTAAGLRETVGTGELLGEVPVVMSEGLVDEVLPDQGPYRRTPPTMNRRAVGLTFIPYHLWANRGPSTMRVWVPRAATRSE